MPDENWDRSCKCKKNKCEAEPDEHNMFGCTHAQECTCDHEQHGPEGCAVPECDCESPCNCEWDGA